jgi:hypothetical protein
MLGEFAGTMMLILLGLLCPTFAKLRWASFAEANDRAATLRVLVAIHRTGVRTP